MDARAAAFHSPEPRAVSSVISLVLPFFGLIFLGYFCAKITRMPEAGLEWMNFFIIYLALPALFFYLIARTPIEDLANWRFVVATTLSTALAFTASLAIGLLASRGNIPEAAIQATAGSYSNIGYMGPGVTLAVLGAGATAPTALIFCFDNALIFTLVPFFMAIGGGENHSAGQVAMGVLKKIFLHPFILATLAGMIAAVTGLQPPTALDQMIQFLKNGAAPCALFAMGVTVALRPMVRVPGEMPFHLIVKLVVHPVLVWLVLGLIGSFDPIWVQTAVLMAALPPALSVFVVARQYNTYVERASSIVLVGTVLSVITLTSFVYIATHDLVPINPFVGW
jgi:predicted permease